MSYTPASVRQHTTVNAEFALFAASCAVCPRLATCCAFGEPGTSASPANLGAAQSASHLTQEFVANQQPENTNDTRPPCGKDLQTTHVPPGDLK